MNLKATLTSKGQVTIPKAIREALGLDAGSQIDFQMEQGELRVRPLRSGSWEELWACATGAPRPDRPVDVKAAILAAVAARAKR